MKLADIRVSPLRRIDTAGGDVLHAMTQNDEGYVGFGEAYFSWVTSGTVKAWKRHTRMTMNVVVPVGQVRFVFCEVDEAGVGKFRLEEIGVDSYARITVPAGIWFGFQGLGTPQSLVLNIASIPHDPDEVERMAIHDLNFIWK